VAAAILAVLVLGAFGYLHLTSSRIGGSASDLRELRSVDAAYRLTDVHRMVIDDRFALVEDMLFAPHGHTSIFKKIDGHWHYVATAFDRADPCLFRLAAAPDDVARRMTGRFQFLLTVTPPFNPTENEPTIVPPAVKGCVIQAAQ
jgi:hypothetical protein